jgi:hypothetical protein
VAKEPDEKIRLRSRARFEAFCQNLPPAIYSEMVTEYHAILTGLQNGPPIRQANEVAGVLDIAGGIR